jgi:quercetin dioxygenase-like cupin family protein
LVEGVGLAIGGVGIGGLGDNGVQGFTDLRVGLRFGDTISIAVTQLFPTPFLKGLIMNAPTQKMISALLLFLSLSFPSGQAANVMTAKREVLVASDHSWNGTKYTHYPSGVPQLTVLKLTVAPHSVLPWHTHPCPNTCYVLSGELTVHDKESGKAVTYHQGQAFAESVDRVHRGETGKAPAVVIITYAGTSGMPTSIPVKGELPEY